VDILKGTTEFSKSRLPERVHEAFIQKSYEHDLVGRNSRDSTAIEAREKPLKKEPIQKTAAKRGRPKQGEERIKPLPVLRGKPVV
jgi:hypothetical protein